MDKSGLVHSFKNNPRALVVSLALHFLLFVLIAISLSSSDVPIQKPSNRETVKAFAVDAAVVEKEIEKLKQAENKKNQKIKNETNKLQRQLKSEKDRLAKIKKEKKAIERKVLEKKKSDAKKKKAIARKKIEEKKKADAKRKIQIKRDKDEANRKAESARLAEIKKREDDVAAEKQRKIDEADLLRKMEEEERRLAKHNDMLASIRVQYVKLIEQKVKRNWSRPTATNSDFKCEVSVTQSRLGDVIKVRFGDCVSDTVLRNSIERAVRKSAPLPAPPNPEVFDREIRFVFKPSN